MEQEQKPQPQTKVKIEVQTKIIKLISIMHLAFIAQ